MGFMTSQYRKVAPARIEQRDVERQPVLLQRAAIRRSRKVPDEAWLVELSIYGCRLLSPGKYKTGDRITLRFPAAEPITATAIWQEDDRLGCRFDEALDRALFRQLTLLTG